MIADVKEPFPPAYNSILELTRNTSFSMSSDVLTCSLLRTLAASKPGGRFLELGTGTGLSTSWILDGMDGSSTLTSIDNDAALLKIAGDILADDKRLQLICNDAGEWITANTLLRFDYIFADTWHGKYLSLDMVLTMVNTGGLYIIDDMLPQPNWPEGHQQKAETLQISLKARKDFVMTTQAWASGIILLVRR